jgi:putative transposase
MEEKTTNHYLPEIRERAIRMVREHQGEYASEWAAVQSIAAKIGCMVETLCRWIRQSQKVSVDPKELGSESERIKAFIDDHRAVYGAESICKVLPIAPSTYYLHAAHRTNPELRSARTRRDEALRQQIGRVWEENFQIYGARKMWQQLQREGLSLACARRNASCGKRD